MAREIKFTVPSVQTIILTVLLLGAMTLIVWISIAVQMEEPQPPSVAAPPPEEGPAAWLSAFGSVLSAVVTGGALMIAALTYQRQIRDRHAELEDRRREDEKMRKAQAQAVTVRIAPYKPPVVNFGQNPNERRQILVRNDGNLAIFGVTLAVTGKDGEDARRRYWKSILPAGMGDFLHPTEEIGMAYATFADSAGTRWKRWDDGRLQEIPPDPKPDE